MRIFGIDPGSERTGYGCVETDGSRHRLVVVRRHRAPAPTSFPDKLHRIHAGLTALLAECRPDCVAIENVFHAGERAQRAASSGTRAAWRCWPRSKPACRSFEYTPAEIKRAVVGYGRAEKPQVQQMVKLLLGLDDGADAARRRRRARGRDLPRARAAAVARRRRDAAGAQPRDQLAQLPRRAAGALDEPADRDRAPSRHASSKSIRTASSSTSPASATTCSCRCRRSTASASRARRSRCASTRTCARTRSRSTASRPLLEQELFERLIGVSGIGPKLALAVLSGIEPRDLIARDRARRPRAADRDSRRRQEDRRADRPRAEGSAAAARRADGGRRRRRRSRPRCATTCVSALVNLGYHRPLAEKAADAAIKTVGSSSDASFERAVEAGVTGSGQVTDDRLVTAARVDDDAQYEAGLRPRLLDEYIGQDRVRENLQVSIAAAKQRGEALDHVLLLRPARARQDDAGLRHRQRAGRAGPRDLRPGDREARRSRRHPHQPRRRAKCCSSTRSTACRRRSRRSSIRRWRTTSSTS